MPQRGEMAPHSSEDPQGDKDQRNLLMSRSNHKKGGRTKAHIEILGTQVYLFPSHIGIRKVVRLTSIKWIYILL